jgi:hypothetical protein
VDVTEASIGANPFITGQAKIGEGSFLLQHEGGALRIGDDIVLGETVLVPTTTTPAAPLASIANRFEISLTMDPSAFAARRTVIERAIRDFVPANTVWTLRLAPSRSGIGSLLLDPNALEQVCGQAILPPRGINASLAAPEPFRVGVSALGSAQALGPHFGADPVPRLERGASVTQDWRLIE